MSRKRQFLEGGKAGIEAPASKQSSHERQLEDEVAKLTTALEMIRTEAAMVRLAGQARPLTQRAVAMHSPRPR